MPTREERFWAKVHKTDGCWEWTGHRQWNRRYRYGILSTGYRRELAHRVSYELHFGPIPNGLDILHHCDNPPCVRPEHLWAGTQADNNRDRDEKGRHRALSGADHPMRTGRQAPLRGIAHPGAKITDRDVRGIRARRANGELLRTIAADYGLTNAHICGIVKRRTWKHIE